MSKNPLDPNDWMGTAEFCAIVGKTRGTVENERSRGSDAPPHYKIGQRIRYRRSEVLAWLEARRIVPAAAQIAAHEAATA